MLNGVLQIPDGPEILVWNNSKTKIKSHIEIWYAAIYKSEHFVSEYVHLVIIRLSNTAVGRKRMRV